jgi:hypothetical protein
VSAVAFIGCQVSAVYMSPARVSVALDLQDDVAFSIHDVASNIYRYSMLRQSYWPLTRSLANDNVWSACVSPGGTVITRD